MCCAATLPVMTELNDHVEFLADRWCESPRLEPLRLLLNAKASLNGLTDGWQDFRSALRSIRAVHGSELPREEFDRLVSAIHITDEALGKDDT